MILTKNEFFEQLHNHVGTDSSDESIAFVENMTDTYNDLEKKANGDGVDWEKKAKEIDEAWKKKYRNRFFSGSETNNPNARESETEEEKSEHIRVEDLFEKEGK